MRYSGEMMQQRDNVAADAQQPRPQSPSLDNMMCIEDDENNSRE